MGGIVARVRSIDSGIKRPGSAPGSASGQVSRWESHFAFLKMGVIASVREFRDT